MKKITLFLVLLISVAISNAQETVYSVNFSDENQVSEWTILDEDGDGLSWSVVTVVDENQNPVAGPLLRSASWNANAGPLTPDNWAITPLISLSDIPDGATIELEWEVSAADASFAAENYTVYVATGNTVADFTSSSVFLNELVTDNGPGGLDNVYTKTLDISSFAGDDVFIAFRHHGVTDEFTIEIHSVEVTSSTLSNNQFVAENNFVQFVNNQTLNLQSSTVLNKIEIFNLAGKRVISDNLSGNSDAQIDINALNQGIYIAKLNTENGMHTFKFAK